MPRLYDNKYLNGLYRVQQKNLINCKIITLKRIKKKKNNKYDKDNTKLKIYDYVLELNK